MNKYGIGDVVRILYDPDDVIGIIVGVEFIIGCGYDYMVLIRTGPENVVRYTEEMITQDLGDSK